MKQNVYLNGSVIPAADATLSVADPGFLHGASVYTTLLAHRGVVFRFGRHLERLGQTVRRLDLRVAPTAGQLIKGLYAVLTANELTEARCRITLTPGPPAGEPTTLITAETLPEYPAEWYEKGIGVIVSSMKQVSDSPVFGIKTGCCLPRLLGRAEAAAKGVADALWYTADNRLAEACFSNVFVAINGELFTPPVDTPVLPGIVREAVLELCGQLNIPCSDHRGLTVKEMLAAEEIFLTSSCMGIRPVVRVERHAVGDEKPGPLTKTIMGAYRELLEQECQERTDL